MQAPTAAHSPAKPNRRFAIMAKKSSPLRSILIVAALAVAAYFINVEVQTRLGEKALAATGLVALPLEQALAQAKIENKLVLANLSAIWCPSCRALDKSVFADETVKKTVAERFIYARVEYENPEGKAFQERYDTKGFPNLLLLKPNGDLERPLPVPQDPASFLQSVAL